jgi:hypothetical protein
MYSGRSSSTSPPGTILAESASLVPEDHIPKCCLAAWAVAEGSLYRYHRRSSPSLEELLHPSEAGSKGLGNRLRGSCAICMRIRGSHIASTEENDLP